MKKWIIVGTGFITLLIVMNSMLAMPVSADVDWLGSQLSAQSDNGDVCSESQEKFINWPSGDITTKSVCVVYGKDFDMAYTEDARNDSLGANPYIRMHGSTEFIILMDVTRPYLIPGKNTVVYEDSSTTRPLVLVNDFTRVVNKGQLPVYGGDSREVPYFSVDRSISDDKFLSTTTTAYGAPVLSYKVSNDGQYVVAYFESTGIAKYNLVTHQTTVLLTVRAFDSWTEWDQPSVAAISDDGRYVLMKPNAKVIDTENCGDFRTAYFNFDTTIFRPCNTRDLTKTVKDVAGPSARVEVARFSEDSGMLKLFVADERDGARRRVTLSTSNVKIIRYLALGDSYSSGEGDVSYVSGRNNYLPGTEDRNKCHISYRSYPFLLKEKWSIDSNDMKSIACSGAHVVSDYYGDGEYIGQHRELEGKSSDKKLHMRSDALGSFAPGIVRQIDFVSKYKPDTVTLTGGGNDVGFGEVIEYCADPQQSLIESCPQVSDPQIVANLRRKIDDEREPMTEFIKKIKEVSPATKVYLIGYPQFVALEGCNDGSILLNKAERLMIRSSVTRLNNILKLVARDTDVYYVDIEGSLEGGQICQKNSLYMTGPLKVLGKVAEGYVQEAYHPNASGHKKIADVIDARIKDNDLSYTIIDIPAEENGQRMVKMAVTKDYAGVGSEQTITMDAGMFEEDGSVDAVMYSNKVPLAKIKVQHDGTLSAKVKIPPEIEPGMHLLTLTGKSVAGDIVQVQQYITIYSNNDGFGVASAKSSSLFSDTSSNGMISNEATEPLLQTTHQKPSLSLGRAVNYEKADNQYAVIRHIFMISVTIILIIVIIVKGTLYVGKKER